MPATARPNNSERAYRRLTARLRHARARQRVTIEDGDWRSSRGLDRSVLYQRVPKLFSGRMKTKNDAKGGAVMARGQLHTQDSGALTSA